MSDLRDLTQGFIDAAPFAIVVCDARGLILQVNPAASRLLGYERDELTGMPIEALVPPERRSSHITERMEYARGRRARPHDTTRQLEAVRKDGERIAVVISLGQWQTPEGPRHVAFIIEDGARVTAEREAIDEHRRAVEAGELSQAIIREASLGIILYDADSGQCVSANAAAATITGLAVDALHGQNFRTIESWKASGMLAAAESALLTGRPVSRDMDFVSTAGKPLALSCDFLAITLRDRPHLVLMMDDLSERRDLERQLRVAQKMEAIGQLAGGVAHDFNNLLTVIGTYSSLLLDEIEPTHPHREDLEEIQSAAKRAATLTRQLLAFGRRQLFDAQLIDLNDVIGGLEKMLRRVLSAEITLDIVPADRLGAIHADPGQVEQAIMNLVVNARDAMPSGGRLSIETENVDVVPEQTVGELGVVTTDVTPRRMVVLRISDTGTGMDDETAARAFEPFYTTKDPGRGTGLGLSTTYGIVKQSGGFMRLRSIVGTGTTFELYFPMAADSELVRTVERAVEPVDARGSGDILVVEDDEHVRKIVVNALAARGYTVSEATNGEEALEMALARQTCPDLLVTDVIMPRLNGTDLVLALRGRWPGLRVLFTTAYAVDEATDQSAAMLPGSLLRKPFVPAELAHAVQTAMATATA